MRSSPPASTTVDSTYAVYDCTGDGTPSQQCAFSDILPVGSRSPKGDGKWGQADLGGSMYEWNLDWSNYQNTPWPGYPTTTCEDCANRSQTSFRAIRGGDWYNEASYLRGGIRNYGGPSSRHDKIGVRCARTP